MLCTKHIDEFRRRSGSGSIRRPPRRSHRVRARQSRVGRVGTSPRRVRPVGVIADGDCHPLRRRPLSGTRLAPSRGAVAFARPNNTVHRVLDHGFGGNACRDLDLRDLDELSFAGAAPVLERSEQGDTGMHPDDGIGGPLQVARRPLGVSRHSRHPRCLLEIERPADVVAPWSLQAESGHAHEDHVGLELHQRLVVQPELLDHPW